MTISDNVAQGRQQFYDTIYSQRQNYKAQFQSFCSDLQSHQVNNDSSKNLDSFVAQKLNEFFGPQDRTIAAFLTYKLMKKPGSFDKFMNKVSNGTMRSLLEKSQKKIQTTLASLPPPNSQTVAAQLQQIHTANAQFLQTQNPSTSAALAAVTDTVHASHQNSNRLISDWANQEGANNDKYFQAAMEIADQMLAALKK